MASSSGPGEFLDSNAPMPLPPPRTPIRPFGLAAGLYLLLTLLLTWPLALHMGSRVPNDLGDSLLNMFILAWDARAVPFTAQWWDLPQFYPAPGVLAFSEHLLGLSIVTTPIISATGNVLAAYNVAFILSFLLCGVAAHLLCFELTRRHDVSLVCGVAYAFAPYRMSQFAHLQVLSAYWVPMTLLGLHLYLRSPRWRWLALFAGSWLMQALACGYYLFYLSVLVGLWILWFAVGRMRAADLGRLLAGWGLAAVSLVPVARGYLTYQGQYGLRRWPDEIQAFSGDVASLLTAPDTLRLWSWLGTVRRPEAAFFPGITLLLVIAAGAAIAWSAAAREGVRWLRTPRVLGAAASALILIAGTPIMFGPWKVEIGGVRLLSVGSSHKPFSIAVVLLAGALALHPSMRAGWARRSAFVFYAIAAVIMWVFSLGPAPTFLNEPLLYKAPYAWLMHVPGVDGVRVPARFWVLATMCLSVACALALRQVLGRWGGRRFLPACVAMLLLLESWPRPLMLEPEPAARAAYGRAVARLELPTSPADDLVALYRAIEHRRPLVNGYSGYFAPHYPALQHLLERRDPAALTYLTSLGPIEVVVDHAGDGDGSWRAYVRKFPGAERVHRTEAFTVYHLPRRAASSSRSGLPGRPLPIADIQASRGQERAHLMVDGDRVSRWHTAAPQEAGDEIVVDLGSPVMIAGVELRLAGYVADFPRLLEIEISDDRAEWRQVWSGSAAREALIAAIEDPRDIPLRFPVEAAGRFVRLRQLGSDRTFFWSIAELRVHGT